MHGDIGPRQDHVSLYFGWDNKNRAWKVMTVSPVLNSVFLYHFYGFLLLYFSVVDLKSVFCYRCILMGFVLYNYNFYRINSTWRVLINMHLCITHPYFNADVCGVFSFGGGLLMWIFCACLFVSLVFFLIFFSNRLIV